MKMNFETITRKAQQSSSMKGNPIQLAAEELISIPEQASEE
jgi:hypothetical protein